MKCPEEIAELLLRILQFGLLDVRASASANDPSSWDRCYAASDHIHNLPGLLLDYSDELLIYYWNRQRVQFIEATGGVGLDPYQSLWDQLSKFIDLETGRALRQV